MQTIAAFAFGLLALSASLSAQQPDLISANSMPAPATDANSSHPTIVLGFLGGFVRHDNPIHSTVQLAQHLRTEFPSSVYVETFENRRRDDAHKLILRLLAPERDGKPTEAEKRSARIILYGHSWGANAVVALARDLQADGIPVLLTVQVDSISKAGQNDAVIPDNVAHAVNFYQDKGFLRGQPQIRPENANHTQILGNFLVDYTNNPLQCSSYPWFNRVFMHSHIQIECDPAVWQRIYSLIRQQLPASVAAQVGAH